MSTPIPAPPTQVRRPWRTTARSIFQFALALATLLPLLAAGVYTDVDQAPAIVGQILVVAGIITRVMALPGVEQFLRNWFPWLAASPGPKTPPAGEGGAISWVALLVIVLVVVIVLAVAGVF